MSLRPVVPVGLAGCCTVLSIFGVLTLSVIGYGESWPCKWRKEPVLTLVFVVLARIRKQLGGIHGIERRSS